MKKNTNTDTPEEVEEEGALSSAKGLKNPSPYSEEEIAEKMRAGLRREQAIEILQTQAAHDAAQAAAEKGKGKA